MKTNNNLLLKTDSYKISHYKQYPEGTEHIYSYIAPRSGNIGIPVLGIHDFCDMLDVGQLSGYNIAELEAIATEHGVPFNQEWWDLLNEYHGEGFPVRILGVPEGTVVEPKKPVAIIVNTDPKYPWLTSFFETLFLRMVWYPSTVAANSRSCKLRIKEFMLRTGADMSTLDFKLHDFGGRGVTADSQAARGGAGHLTQFQGTDTLEAVKYIKDNYGLKMAGYSIPATEHSTVTSWGRDCEEEMYETFIRRNLGDSKVASCVSDSYNIWDAIKTWKKLEPILLEVGGTLVIRPDSGDPIQTPVKVIEECLQEFGYTTNEKGFKVLPDHIRVIQGDGIDEDKMVRIMQILVDKHISIDNIAFGMGGGLLQKVDRDTFGWAMKCSAARVNGVWRDVYKDPIGGGKTSLKGLVVPSGVVPYDNSELIFQGLPEGLMEYYNNGVCAERPKWELVRHRSSI